MFVVQAQLSAAESLTEAEIVRYFHFAAIWAFGGMLEADSREVFSNYWRMTFDKQVKFPAEGLVSG